jgi:menaquinone-dependent protoporphyrinogen oxidase
MSRPNILVLYATRHGQAKKVSERLAADLEAKGANVDVINADGLGLAFDLERYRAAILVASVHLGKHEPEMISFARRNRAMLADMPSAFVSVSMAEATIEGKDRTPDARAQARLTLRKAIDHFVEKSGWKPAVIRPVAGALLYREYGFFIRWIMKMIARQTGAGLDTSRNYEYTDWDAVDRIAAEFDFSRSRPPLPETDRRSL